VIGVPPGVRVLVATKPVDFRCGTERLAAIAKSVLKQDVYAGAVLVFRARRADRVKIVTWDGTGLVMVWKSIDGGFKWPPISDCQTVSCVCPRCQTARNRGSDAILVKVGISLPSAGPRGDPTYRGHTFGV